jgi:hypothetical protein
VPAVSDKELGPEFALKIAYLIRERRSGNVKSLCRPTEMQLLGDRYEVSELPELHEIDVNARSQSRHWPFVIAGGYHT